MNSLKIFENEELGLKVRAIKNDDGSISINAEDTAIGFGWTKHETKNGKTYTTVRWERMNGYSSECGFAHEWSKNDYIPESLFYMLGMKANNETALKYQKWLAMEVLPSIRRTGSYHTASKEISFKEQVECIGVVAEMLRANDASKILMLRGLYKTYNLPSDFLPKYEFNGSREMKSATELLKRFDLGMSVKNFNLLMMAKGFLEEKTRNSSSNPSAERKYKCLTEKGLKYGENAVSPQNQRETQPLYYSDVFKELFEIIVGQRVA